MLSWLQIKKRDERRKARRKGKTYTPLFERLERERIKQERALIASREKAGMKNAIWRSIFSR